jgi:class 3 adenylate cyclase/Tfp pilus assembly protein PilF
MKTLFFIIFILINTQFLNAQLQGQAKIDSLLKELPKIKEDTNGVKLLKEISIENYILFSSDKAIEFIKKSLDLSIKINWQYGITASYNNLGLYFQQKNDSIKAVQYFNKALILSKKYNDKAFTAKILLNLGRFYLGRLDHPKSIAYSNSSLEIYKELDYKKGICISLSVIASTYQAMSNYSSALEYSLNALKICEFIDDEELIIPILKLIGGIYLYKKDYQKSLEYDLKALNNYKGNNSGALALMLNGIGASYYWLENYSESLKYYKKALTHAQKINYHSMTSILKSNIGLIFSKEKKYSEAKLYFDEALDMSKEYKYKRGIADIEGNLGEMYLLMSRDFENSNIENKTELFLKKDIALNKAVDHLLNSVNMYNEIGGGKFYIRSFDYLSEAYQLKGDYLNALKYYKESQILHDSIFSSENNTKIANLEAKRENELKEKEIEILKAEKEKEKLQRYAMFGGIAGLGIIIGLILIQRRKSEKLLLNVLPEKIAKRLKAKEHPIADHFDGASVIFIDIVGFTSLSSNADPKRVVSVLNDIFTSFDKLADKHGLEKIKTIGDAYMAVAGIPEIQKDHSKRTAQMALDIKSEMKDFKTSDGTEIKFRIGIDCGAVVAGVIGEKKFIYDLWSDAVNTASRMESTGESGQIQITENFKTELEKFDGNWNFTFRGEFEIKGKGIMKTYFLED